MELVTRLALTASIIAALLLIASRFGERVAGLLSGLPFMTAPALLQIGAERGVVSSAEAALGGVGGGALAALFALAYCAAARRLSPTATLAFALGCLTAALVVCGHMPLSLTWAAAMACGCSAIALRFIGHHPASAGGGSPGNRQRVRPALAIGLTSAAVTTLAAEMHPWLAGLVTAMPIIGVVTIATCHRTRGALAVPPFLRAYVLGSLVKTSFCAAFALFVTAHGVFPALLFAALASLATGTFILGCRPALEGFAAGAVSRRIIAWKNRTSGSLRLVSATATSRRGRPSGRRKTAPLSSPAHGRFVTGPGTAVSQPSPGPWARLASPRARTAKPRPSASPPWPSSRTAPIAVFDTTAVADRG